MTTKASFKNISDLLRTRVSESPDKLFLFSQTDGRQFTYQQFAEAVNRAAALLVSKGIRKGDAVSLLMPNSVEYVIAYFACWQIGALAGPVNSLLKAQEIEYVVTNSDSRALLASSDFLPVIEPLKDQLPTIITFDDETQATSGVDLSNLNVADVSVDDEAIIIYTSGTTGKPKGCLLTHGNVISNARQISEWLGFGTNDRLLTMMPLFHMNAVSVTTMSALYAGGSSVVTPKFSGSRL